MQLSLAGTPAAGPLGYQSWALFEWARNPYVILITIYIFAPYFTTTVVGDPVQGQSLLGFANSLSGALIACMAPLLGAVADKKGRRKPWIATFIVVMVPAVWLLWFAMPGGAGIGIYPTLALIVVIAILFEFSAVFHNAMLPSVAPASKIGTISGLALAYGNFAGLSLMIFVLYAFSLPGEVTWDFIPERPLFGLDPAAAEPDRIVAPLVAVWLLLFTLPLLAFTPDGRDAGHGIRQAVSQGLLEVWRTVRQLRHYFNVAKYLLARMLFNDGMVGVLIFGGVYAAGTFGWGTTTLLLFGIITSFSAAVGAVLGGWLDDRLGSRRTVLIAVGGTALLLAVAVTIQPDSILFIPYHGEGTLWELPYFNTLPEFLYFANTQLFAMFITVAFASARTMMARLAPPTLVTQFFGLYALSGTATAFLAPLMVGVFTSTFQSQQVGYASLIILLVAGFIGMLFVREEQAVAAGDRPST
jgi:MFS transporter, UMF1 family